MNLGFLTEERECYVLGLLRAAFATLLLLLTFKLADELRVAGHFGDVFHMSLLPESWVPSRGVYLGLLGCQALACVLSLVGLCSRPALFFAASASLYALLCDRLRYHNNRYELVLLALLVAITPCDRSFLRFRPARPGPAPRWAVRLVGAQLSVVYLASSLGKLFDPAWRTGTVLQHRFALNPPELKQLLPSLNALVTSHAFAQAAALFAIATELFLALGLWAARTRAPALWLGVMFHAGIELSAHVELFSYTMFAGYLAFVRPELRERRVSWSTAGRAGRRLALLCARLDLMARFRHEASAEQSELLVVEDRRGVLHRGLAAWRELARASWWLFPAWVPLCIATWLRREAPARA